MRLSRDWSQLFFNAIIDDLSSINNFRCASFHIITEYSEILVHDLTKDHFNTVGIE